MAISSGDRPSPPQIGAPLELEAVRSEPLQFLTAQAAQHGDIFAYQVDAWRAVVVNHPSFVRQVLHADTRRYSKIGTPDLLMLRPMLGSGLMTSEGPAWLAQRRAAQPAFNRKSMAPLAPLMVEAAQQLVTRWRDQADAETPIDVTEDLSALTLYIVARCLFGADLDQRYTAFGASVGVLNEFMGHFDPSDQRSIQAFREALATLQRTVGQIVAGAEGAAHSQDELDLLDRLLAAPEASLDPMARAREISDQIFTFLMAGHETTAKALTWTLYLLGTDPEVERRLRGELDRVLQGQPANAAAIDALPYTWQVLQEAMRLFPPVWSMTRMCVAGDEIGGYDVAPGTLVVISPYILHRHPGFWSDPERFDPDRFSAERIGAQMPYAYLPFSTGARLCIGQPFAAVELVLVLVTLLQGLRFRLPPGHRVIPEALVTLRPKGGLPLQIGAIVG